MWPTLLKYLGRTPFNTVTCLFVNPPKMVSANVKRQKIFKQFGVVSSTLQLIHGDRYIIHVCFKVTMHSGTLLDVFRCIISTVSMLVRILENILFAIHLMWSKPQLHMYKVNNS